MYSKTPAGTKLQVPFYFHLTESLRAKLIFRYQYRLFPYPISIFNHNFNYQKDCASYPTTNYQPQSYSNTIEQNPRIKDQEEDGRPQANL